jgi:hypothetical protein
MGNMRNAHKLFVETHEGEMSLWSHWRRWKNNIKIALKELRCPDMNWILLTQSPVVDSSEHGNEPSDSKEGRECLDWLAAAVCSRRTLLREVRFLYD